MNRKILITGADGLLGSHVVRHAIHAGYLVKAFVQAGRSTGTLDGLDIEIFRGDLTNPQDVQNAMRNCDYLVHSAGSTSLWPGRSSAMWRVNFDSVVALVEAAKVNNIKRFIHIGSASSFGYGSRQTPGDENSPFLGKKFNLDYLDTKKSAQDYLIKQFELYQLPVIILAPTFIVGEYDTTPNSGKMIISVARRRLPGFSAGGKCIAYAGDIAAAAVNALTMGRPGQCYITGGENLTYHEFFDLISDLAETRRLKFLIPTPLAVLTGGMAQVISKLTRKAPLLSRTMARMSADTHFYTSSKAISELLMPQTPPREAIRRSIDYLKQIGYL